MSDKQIIDKLHDKGYKVTPQRLAIFKLILTNKNHPSVDQIYEMVIKKFPTISIATVYQNLHLLEELGLVHELKFNNNMSRYDPNTKPHINLICPKCNKIVDYESKNVKNFFDQIVADLKIKQIDQRIDIYRYCDKCSKK